MNILIIGYCNLEDGFLYASKALEKLNYKIYFFPFLNYKLDNNDNYYNDFDNIIINEKINICLWWNNTIKYEEINKMLKKDKINIFYNWDPFLYNYEKYNTNNWIERIDNKKKIYGLMDHIFSCFEKEINYFKNLSLTYCPPGFDKNISLYKEDENFKCDISFILTNIYNDNKEFPEEATNINRYEIINKIYENRGIINFHIYGPEHLKNLYPDCYKSFIKYDECYKVFSNSKINLSIHPIIYELNKENSTEEYFSERLPQILGSKGLLMTNSNLNSKLKKNKDYIYIDKYTDYIKLIIDIINNNERYNKIRENGYKKAIQYYQWENWSNIINNKLSVINNS